MNKKTSIITKDHFIRYRNNGKDVTYILGARCKDGIVIVSDSKVSRGAETHSGSKLFTSVNGSFVAASGTTGVFSKFLNQIHSEVEDQKIITWNELVNVVEDLVLKLNDRYYRRSGGESIEVLMGINTSEKDAELHHITPRGIAEEISDVIGIGHGEPYGSIFLKTIWNQNMTMKQTAELASLIIRLIDFLGLDSSVDSTPQIGYIPFHGDPHYATSEEIEELVNNSFAAYEKFVDHFDEFLKIDKSVKTESVSA